MIIPLADRPDAIPLLAAWFHAEWHAIDGREIPEIEKQLGQNLEREKLPITFLEVREGQVAGTASLDVEDLPGYDEKYGPWLACVYVEPKWRGHGIAATLARHAVRFARKSGATRLSLWTENLGGFYPKLGFVKQEDIVLNGHPAEIFTLRF